MFAFTGIRMMIEKQDGMGGHLTVVNRVQNFRLKIRS
jgi:hypothetical protein